MAIKNERMVIDILSSDEDITPLKPKIRLSGNENNILEVKVGRERNKVMDDDCCILDFYAQSIGFNAKIDFKVAEDLIVVGEKGPVACRDYPHPRHLCAKFPFNKTPHSLHCPQLHVWPGLLGKILIVMLQTLTNGGYQGEMH
ncbi:hypothetical protein AMTR_s00111p00146210 [Amborella trichopoda]|uniref:Uncharacterized protein n=1 Tax=Amborella trichopoda TaxID=13333 RepID=W1NZZ7_AMBTC|nr:hypothetical protein AMTR_s00111p00146210 [Amborella trichopoda]